FAKAVFEKAVAAPVALAIKLVESSLTARLSLLCLPALSLLSSLITECSSPDDHSLLCIPRVLLT
ncbi:hypothetical protein Tco_0354114, partial [Tanacetum coccineum]